MEERKLILKMIEEGKISAEEGEVLIETIEKGKKTEDQSNSFHKGSQQRQKTEHFNAEQFQRVKDELQEATDRIITSANKGASKLFEVLGKTIQKVQEVDLDFDFNLQGGIKVVEEIQLTPFNFQNLHVSSSNGSIRCMSSQKDYAEIIVTAFVSKVKDENAAREKLLQAIEQKEEDDKYNFSLADEKGIRATIELKIPSRLYEQLTIKTNLGSIQIMDVQTQEVDIKTSNGSIRIEKLETDHLKAETSNGRIQVHQVEVEKALLKSSNGSVHSAGYFTSLHSETTNGSIRIKQEKVDESQIKAITNNGSIKVIYPQDIKGVHGELKTRHGNVKCTLPEVQLEEDGEHSQIKGKKLSFKQGEKQAHSITAESNTGSVQVYEQEGVNHE
jgi:DUF4097 and DUF4098 domain-containing protein YvlB